MRRSPSLSSSYPCIQRPGLRLAATAFLFLMLSTGGGAFHAMADDAPAAGAELRAGLELLAKDDPAAAAAAFGAVEGSEGGTAEILGHLAEAYATYRKLLPEKTEDDPKPSKTEASNRAHRHLKKAQRAAAAEGADVAALRAAADLAAEVGGAEMPSLLRTLRCHLRILAAEDEPEPLERSDEDPAIREPVRLFEPEAPYTNAALETRIHGVVILAVDIGEDGCTSNPDVLKTLAYGLDRSARRWVRWWVFEPAERDGKALAVKRNVTLNFRIP